jgi:hypothetical protein
VRKRHWGGFIMWFLRAIRWLPIIAAIVLSGCGGGGDGGQGSGLSISPTSLTFSANQNGSIPPTQYISVSITAPDAAAIIAGYPAGSSVPGWLNLTLNGSGTSWNVGVSITDTSLAPGTYNATVRVLIANASGGTIGYRDAAVTYTIVNVLGVSTGSLNFSHTIGAAPNPANQNINITGTGINWTATADQAWVQLGSTTGTAPSMLSVGVNPAGLSAGVHTAQITVLDTGSADTATIDVTLTITAPSFTVSQSALSFSGVNGANIPAQGLNISVSNGDDISWSAASGVGWLILDKTSGTNTPDSILVSVDPSIGSLSSGTYNSTITVTGSSAGYAMNKVINVTLTLAAPTLSITQSSITLGGSDGRDTATQPLEFSINTGANTYLWTATLDSGTDNWLIADSVSGNLSATPTTINLDANRSSIVGGTYSGTATISVTVNGDIVSGNVPVTLNLKAHKLFISDNGVALSSMPTVSKLSHTVQVTSNLGRTTSWSASSNQTWLTATASGTTTGDLTLTADPTGLTTDTLNLATVTVSSSDTTIENTETVRVGFWVGSTDPNASDTIATTFTEVEADPVRPYIYVHAGGTDISVYNVYTAAPVTTVSSVGSTLSDMTISNDGSMLYVIDSTNTSIVPVNLDTYVIGSAWSLAAAPSYPRLAYSRPDTVGVVLASDGRIYQASDGSRLTPTFSAGNIAANANSDVFFIQALGSSGHSLYRYSIAYTEVGGGQLLVSQTHSRSESGFAADIAVNADGTRVYTASWSPYNFPVYDGSDLTSITTLVGAAYPAAVEVDLNGLLFAASRVHYGAVSTAPDVWIYDTTYTEKANYYLSGYAKYLLDRQLVVSGDGIRMIGLTNDPKLIFTTVGP